MFQNWYTPARVQRTISSQQTSNPDTHPLFEPVSITSHSPLLETDYNLHKSNSTYFSDLDESRTALVTKLLIPGLKAGNKDLERQGHKGPLNVILGSVHTSFHREIKPYERYEVRSRILGWDKKWIVIESWFVRPANRRKGKGEVILASALSKYVVKKGKFTVSPERCFTTAGWLPDRPEEAKETNADETGLRFPKITGMDASSEEPSLVPTPQEGVAEPLPDSLVRTTSNIVERLEGATEKTPVSKTESSEVGSWDWHRIEKERLRGLHIAQAWLSLDKELVEEFSKQ